MMTSELIRMELPAMISFIFSTLDNMFKWRIYLNPVWGSDRWYGCGGQSDDVLTQEGKWFKKGVNACHTFCPQIQTNTGMCDEQTDKRRGYTSYRPPLCLGGRIYTQTVRSALLPSILSPCLWQAVKQQVWKFSGCGGSELLSGAAETLPWLN